MGGKKLLPKILSLLMSISFLITLNPIESSAVINIRESEKIKSELRTQETKLRKALNETKGKIEKKTEYKNNLNSQIENTNKQIRLASSRISALDRDILTKTNEIKNLETDISSTIETLKTRLVKVYEYVDVGPLEIVLGANSFDDLIDKFEVMSRMSDYDAKLVNKLETQINTLENDKKTIESNKVKISEEKDLLSTKQGELKGLIDETEKVLEELGEEKEKEQSCIDENNAECKRIDAEIKRYYEEQARREREKNGNKTMSSQPGGTEIITSSGKGYAWPVPGFNRISAYFNEKRGNRYHKGIDIARSNGVSIYGAKVVAAADGVIFKTYNGCVHDYLKNRSCGCGGGYGNNIYIDHGNFRMTVYGHLSNVLVRPGQTVQKGQVIGYVGCTGHSTGPHLHFECRLYNEKYDPLSEYR